MKNALVFLMTLVFLQTFAQKKDKSSNFDIPEGNSKVLQLNNGNTFYMEITKKEGIKVYLFDTLRKKISSSTLSLKLIEEKIGYYIDEDLFEINGDAVLFLQIGKDRTPILIRIIVDGKTGKLKSEEQVSQLDKMKGGSGYAVIFGDVDVPDFDVTKDPESDYYSIVRYNSMVEETNKRIEVLHYNPQHKIINQAYYVCTDNEFKYTKYLNTYVSKDNYVMIAAYLFNTKSSGGKEARHYLAQLSKGQTTFKQEALPYTEFYKNTSCSFEYNKSTKLLHSSLISFAQSKGNTRVYTYNFLSINPNTLKVEKTYVPDFAQVNDYYQSKMERKDEFTGVLKKSKVDKNGNLILFFQQTTYVTTKESVHVYLGDMAILTINPSGKTIASAVFPASFLVGEFSALDEALIVGESNAYVIFNNSVENMEKPENKEPKRLKARGPAVPVKFTYANSAIKKDYLMKAPKKDKGNPYLDLSTWNYNSITKKFVSIYLDPEKDKACLMYFHLD